ncbi:MAG: Spy/CpxP family protein refolding chaperone [Bacteroidales bacterium]
MKTRMILPGLMLVALFLLPAMLMAQGGPGIANLSEEQKTKISAMRTSHMKEMQQLKNLAAENRAHYRTLMSADKADMAAINKNIEEFGKLRVEMMKKQAAHKQDIRSLLTEEQRLAFDMKQGKGMHDGEGCEGCRGMKGDGKKQQMGPGHGKGRGFGPGQGPASPAKSE